ncbi:hypothetical protein TNCV_5128871 [Trichonephila clavipes]|nr:hypothetical protein TNCV_5128871 [Trichonephila clavipes]
MSRDSVWTKTRDVLSSEKNPGVNIGPLERKRPLWSRLVPKTINELKRGCGCLRVDKDLDKQYKTPISEWCSCYRRLYTFLDMFFSDIDCRSAAELDLTRYFI